MRSVKRTRRNTGVDAEAPASRVRGRTAACRKSCEHNPGSAWRLYGVGRGHLAPPAANQASREADRRCRIDNYTAATNVTDGERLQGADTTHNTHIADYLSSHLFIRLAASSHRTTGSVLLLNGRAVVPRAWEPFPFREEW
jgi:hypothetical protein